MINKSSFDAHHYYLRHECKVNGSIPRNHWISGTAPFVLHAVEIWVAYPTVQHFECHIFLTRFPEKIWQPKYKLRSKQLHFSHSLFLWGLWVAKLHSNGVFVHTRSLFELDYTAGVCKWMYLSIVTCLLPIKLPLIIT